MPSYNFIGLIGLSILVASSGALPSPPFNGPSHGRPHVVERPDGPIFSRPTGISGGPIFPTGLFPTGSLPTGSFPTGLIPSGTATNGLPVLPEPTAWAEEFPIEKRFEGPRHKGPSKPWHHYKPRPTKPSGPTDAPPPFATGGPFPSGTGGPSIGFSTGGPFPPGPTAS